MVREITSAILRGLAFMGITIIVVIGISSIIAFYSWWPFMEAFGFGLVFGGVVVMYAGTMVSAGAAEGPALRAAYMTGGHKAKYYEQYSQERQSRRDSQFWHMLLMVVSGLILMGIGIYII